MVYNSELVEKVSYGSDFGSYGVIEEIDIRAKFVDTVLRIEFKEGEGGLFFNVEEPYYIMCNSGVFNVSCAEVNEGDYIPFNNEYVKVLAEGLFEHDTKTFTVGEKANSIKVLLDSGEEAVIIQSNMEGRYSAFNLKTEEFIVVESKIVFDSPAQTVKMYTRDLDNSVSIGSFDFEDWELL